MDTKLLEQIGLTKGEVNVYLALLKLGSCRTGQLASMAGVSSSKVYKILDRLEKKGLAGHVLKGNIKYFAAMEPRRIIDYLEERQERLEEDKKLMTRLLPELERHKKAAEHKTEATLYDGYKAVTNFFRNIVDELKPGEEYYVIGAGYGEVPGLRAFFYKHHARRIDKGIKLNMLANHDLKGKLEKTTGSNSEIRFLPHYFVTNMEIVFYKNKVFIAMFTKEPKGFLLESDEAVKSFGAYFNGLWDIAEK